MFNLRHLIRPFLPIAAVALLCLTAAPDAHANTGSSSSVTPTQTTEATTGSKESQDSKSPKAAQKPSQKSIFDADVLERPLSYFKNSFSSDNDNDDDDDMLSHGNTVIIAIKALLASLLSTII